MSGRILSANLMDNSQVCFNYHSLEKRGDAVLFVRLCFGVYLGVRTCEVFLCFVVIVWVRVYYLDFSVFLVLHHW